MRKLATLTCIAALASFIGAPALAEDTPLPAKMTAEDMSGTMFEREDTTRTERNGHTVLDVTSLLSSDGKFGSGLYRAGPSRFAIDEPYGVDEFMYFLEGGVTLTSADGSVLEVNAGEAVTLPKEWTGVWETEGYTKIWVIYSEDGSGLQ
ncbi:cupin domain-containing protein [Haliea sp. E1-2-M8]|uniref:cupin domain-containing protein n=1 Tax=Haliea sp. E1-2-M8 TaxID=3064706 RepID=UPI002723763E|nr:cupin domain-containing protein [Haliea sp. E1-2-M8]MDO8861149.1 cupin domain-containing protein [Haliea sp. E1-2-M8]